MTTTTTTTNRASVAHAPKQETRVETLQRLVLKARAEGMKIYRVYQRPGFFVAISTGQAGAYMVKAGTPTSRGECQCPGFQRHHYCKHYAVACCIQGLFPAPEAPAQAAAPAQAGQLSPASTAPIVSAARFTCDECQGETDTPLNFGLCAQCEYELAGAGEGMDLAYEAYRETQWDYVDQYDDADEWMNA